nr:M16 family metallopeptidase [Sphingomonas sp. CROZ-RG-20F-R02-07]
MGALCAGRVACRGRAEAPVRRSPPRAAADVAGARADPVRHRRFALLLAGAALPVGATAQTPPVAGPAPVVAAPAASWQSVGSDIPADPAWRTGTLANGLRYAVRRGTTPPGSVSVRVRIDAGALMERDAQQGWTHLLEHMVFRGTDHYPDGEGIRLWQRLGASFGSDTNAFTTLGATTYFLDLPKADARSYGRAMDVLAEMMRSATIDPALLATERRVVLAELAQRKPPLAMKIEAASQPLLFAGTKAATRDVGGTAATLGGATAPALKAFYRTWYRPSRAVVVVVGDADPALLEQGVRDAFGGWAAAGPPPAEPNYGSPIKPPAPAALVSDPQAPNSAAIVYVTPHDARPWTVARQQRQYLDAVAAGVIRQRLGAAAQSGGALIGASVGLSSRSHVEDQLGIAITPRPGAWKAALDETMGVLNTLAASPPDPAEINQQAISLMGVLNQLVATAPTIGSAALATGFVNDVDAGDVSGPRSFYRDLFAAERRTLTPDVVGAAIRRLLAPDPRLLLLSSTPVTGGTATVVQALAAARAVGPVAAERLRPVSLDDLVLTGTPATVVSSTMIADLGIERVRFSNGVTLDMKKTAFEKDRIRLDVRVGHGLLSDRPGDPGLFWTAPALLAGGIGPFSADELARATAGHQVGFGVQPTADALLLSGPTQRSELRQALKLVAGFLTQPRFRANPVERLKDGLTASYQTAYSQPASVFGAFGTADLYGGDARFRGLPSPTEIAALDLPAFERFWTGALAQGPIRVSAVGDLDRDALVAAVGATLGRLPPRTDVPLPGPAIVAKAPPGAPIVLRHRGAADQAFVARAWPTAGFLDDVPTARALDLAATIVQTRLTEEFREQQGGTYSPFVTHSQPPALAHYGMMIAGAQLQVGRIADFEAALARILTDIAVHGPGADQMARAKATSVSAAERAMTDNARWQAVLRGDLDDPARLAAIRGYVSSRAAVTAAQVQAAVARYLVPLRRSFTIRVLPQSAK